MKLLILLLFTTMLGAVEIEGLPSEVTVDPKEIIAGKEYEVFATGYVTVRLQKYGYLDAKVHFQDGKMIATPGKRYTIRSVTIIGATPERQACEIAITPDNMQLLQMMFSSYVWGRSYTVEDLGVHCT